MTTTSLLTQIPTNTSLLQPNRFTFTFPNMNNLTYNCQKVILPGVSTGGIQVPTPFSDTFRHGTQLKFDELNVSVLIDEDMRTWEETYNWLRGLTRPSSYDEYLQKGQSDKKNYHDAVLTINTNANTPNLRFSFKNCHPLNIGSIEFSVTENADMIITMPITFRYDYYELIRP